MLAARFGREESVKVNTFGTARKLMERLVWLQLLVETRADPTLRDVRCPCDMLLNDSMSGNRPKAKQHLIMDLHAQYELICTYMATNLPL